MTQWSIVQVSVGAQFVHKYSIWIDACCCWKYERWRYPCINGLGRSF